MNNRSSTACRRQTWRAIRKYLCLGLALAALPAAGQVHRDTVTIELEGEVFARKGSVVLTHADLDAFMARIPEKDRAGVLSDPQRIARILEELFLVRLIAADGIEQGLLDEPSIHAHLYQAAMVYLAEQQLERVKDDGELADYTQQARELYLRDPEAWRREEKVDFTHLMIGTDERPEAEAEALIREIARELEAGTDFRSLIREHSEAPGASNNFGRHRDVSPDELDPDFAAALRELKPGQYSQPVLSRFGWHIIRLDRYQPEGIPDFDEIAGELAEQARREHRRQVDERYIRRLMGAPMHLEEGAVQKLLDRYGVGHGRTSPDAAESGGVE